VSGRGGHLRCPYCEAYGVDRLYLGSLRADLCACASCGAHWDEDPLTGEVLGHGDAGRAGPGPRSHPLGHGTPASGP
jgi:hypothetical protein